MGSPYLDPHIVGLFTVGSSRVGVREPYFDSIIAKDLTVEVTRKKRLLGSSQNSTTGWFTVTWEDVTIDAVVTLSRGSRQELDAGIYGSQQGIIRTADPLNAEDRIVFQGVIYVVLNPVREIRKGEGFMHREATISKLSLAD